MSLALLLSLCFHLGILFFLNFTSLPRTEAGTGEIRTIAMVKLKGNNTPQEKSAPLPFPDETVTGDHDSTLVPSVTDTPGKDHILSREKPEVPSVEPPVIKPATERSAEPRKGKAQPPVGEATAVKERTIQSSEVQEASTTSSFKDSSPSESAYTAPDLETTNALETCGQHILDPSSAGATRRVKPLYPRASRLKHEEGEVIIILDIHNGKVKNVTVEVSSGHPRLDEAAVKALREWHFTYPGKAKVRVPVAFRLEE